MGDNRISMGDTMKQPDDDDLRRLLLRTHVHDATGPTSRAASITHTTTPAAQLPYRERA